MSALRRSTTHTESTAPLIAPRGWLMDDGACSATPTSPLPASADHIGHALRTDALMDRDSELRRDLPCNLDPDTEPGRASARAGRFDLPG